MSGLPIGSSIKAEEGNSSENISKKHFQSMLHELFVTHCKNTQCYDLYTSSGDSVGYQENGVLVTMGKCMGKKNKGIFVGVHVWLILN